MKVIVNNEFERMAIEKLLNGLSNWGMEEIEIDLTEYNEMNELEFEFCNIAVRCKIEIDENEKEIESYDEFTVKCSECGIDIYVDDDEPNTLEKLKREWLCKECWEKE